MPYMVSLESQSPFVPSPIDIPDYTPGTLSKPITVNGERIVSMINSGTPLDPAIVPKRFSVGVVAKSLPDIFSLKLGLGVTKTFREKVEELEPGIHQFFSIALRDKSGEVLEERYWLLNICNRVDAVDLAKSEQPPTGKSYDSHIVRTHGEVKIVLRNELISGKCMWIDRRVGFAYFFSDELMDFVEANNLTKFRSWKVCAD